MSNLFFSMFLKKLFSYIILFGANRLILSGKYLILLHFYYVFKEFIMILSCSNICKSFGENDILKQVSFHIEDHEKAAIVGINGAGKSTPLKVLIGKLNADDGSCYLGERCFHRLSGTAPGLRGSRDYLRCTFRGEKAGDPDGRPAFAAWNWK